MVEFYKHFTIIYEISSNKIIVKSILAHGNFTCTYSEHIYNNLEELKRDLDSGKFGP